MNEEPMLSQRELKYNFIGIRGIPLFFTFLFFFIVTTPGYLFGQGSCTGWLGFSENCEDAPIVCDLEEHQNTCYQMHTNVNNNGPGPMCNGDEVQNANWFAFYAACEIVGITWAVMACPNFSGANLSVFSYPGDGKCTNSLEEPEEILFCQYMCFDINNASFFLENLTPGKIYYILLNGCGGGCSMLFHLSSQPQCELPPYIGLWNGKIEGDTMACLGNAFTYCAPEPYAAMNYHWYLDGTSIADESEHCIDIYFTDPGTYELCVDASNICVSEDENPDLLCKTIVVESIVGIDPDPKLVCEGEVLDFGGFQFSPAPSPGATYTVPLANYKGCDSIVSLTLVQSDLKITDYGDIYLCPNETFVAGGVIHNAEVHSGLNEIILSQAASPFCDSIIRLNINGTEVTAKIQPSALQLDCSNPEIHLDGTNSIANPDHLPVQYEWSAYQGGVLGPGFDEEIMTVYDSGKYCLTVHLLLPDGKICSDSVCVIISKGDILDIKAWQDGQLTCASPIVNLIGFSADTSEITGAWFDPSGNPLPTIVDTNFLWLASAVDSGFYTFRIHDAFSCTLYTKLFIESNILLPDITANASDITCIHPGTLSGMSLTPDAEFTWKDSLGHNIGNSAEIFPVSSGPGNYTLVVNNPNNGCMDSILVFIDEHVVPPIPMASSEILTCAVPNPHLSGGSNIPNANYLWTFNGNQYSAQKDTLAGQAGAYTLIITNPDNGCTSDTTIIVEENTLEPYAQVTNDTIDCAHSIATLMGSSDHPGNSFQWFDHLNSYLGNTPSIQVIVPGIYTFIVTGQNGCTRAVSAEVIDNFEIPNIGMNATSDSISCLTDKSVIAVTSNMAVTYQWNNGDTSSTINVSNAGVYCVTVTADNGCTNEMCYLIVEDLEVPIITSTSGGILDCVVTCIELGATSPTPNINYQWTTAGGTNLPSGSNPCVSSPGMYSLLVTGQNGCTATATTLVEASPDIPQDVQTSVSGLLSCVVDEVEIVVSSTTPGATYFWTGPSVPPGSETHPSLNVSVEGLYQVVITNPANGCTTQADITVLQDTVSPILLPTGGLINCLETEAEISVSALPSSNVSFAWFDPNGNLFGSNSSEITISEPGNWNVVVTNNANGCTASTTVDVVDDRDFPDLAALVADTINCYQSSSTLNAESTTPGVLYFWSGPGINPGNQALPQPEVALPGFYTVVVTDPVNGCVSSESIEVIEDITFPEIILQGFTLNCTTPLAPLAATVTPASGIDIAWTHNGNFLPDQTPTIHVADDGQYKITVRNTVNGCVTMAEATIESDFEEPDIQVSGATLTCLDFTGMVAGSSSTLGITYAWTGPGIPAGQEANPSFMVSIPGHYTLVITAPNGCTNQATAMVTEEIKLPTAVATSSNILDCTNETTTLSSSGSSAGTEFTYSWSLGGQMLGSSPALQGVSQPGAYTFVVRNIINGCFSEAIVVVEENQEIPTSLEVDLKNPSCFNFKDGRIVVTNIIGGTPDFLYSLNGGPFTSNPQFAGLGEGSYTITIQDAAGCLYSAPPFNLVEPLQLTVDLGEDILLQWGKDTFLYALISPPNATIESILWTPTGVDTTGNSQEIHIKPFHQTLYGIVVTDDAHCQATDNILVLVEKHRPIYIPNVFAPTGEQNTRFYIQAGEGVEEIEVFEVFSRWGERVFHREHFQPNIPSLGWDGTFRNQPSNPEVYVYYTRIRFNDGITLLYKGDVVVLR